MATTDTKVTVQPEEETQDAKFTVLDDMPDFNPLEPNTDDKPYVVHSTLPPLDIPEPTYADAPPVSPPKTPPPSGDKNDTPKADTVKTPPSSGPTPPKVDPPKPKPPTKAISEDDVEATAGQILDAYEAYFPQLFIAEVMPWCPKFKMKDVNKYASKGMLDLHEMVQAQGLDPDTNKAVPIQLPMGDYFTQHNGMMDSIFLVKPEEKEALREPLIAVLREEEIQLTPTQRLLMAVGLQTGTRLVACLQISAQNKKSLNSFMEAHKERMESLSQQLKNRLADEARQRAEEEAAKRPPEEITQDPPEQKIPKPNYTPPAKKVSLKQAISKKKRK